MDEKKGLKYFIRIAGSLFLIAAIMAFALALVNGVTKDKIAQNNLDEMNSSIAKIFGDNIEIEEITSDSIASPVKQIYKVKSGDSQLGYAVYAAPVGFKAEIEMIVGIENDYTCKAVQIITLSETPGLGAKVSEDNFLSQFQGKSDGLVVKEDIKEVAGATISSRTVVEAVNASIEAAKLVGGEK